MRDLLPWRQRFGQSLLDALPGLRDRCALVARGIALRVVGSVQVIGGKIQIVPPKTASTVRTLPLPDVLLQVVLRHRELQEQEREAYGPDWNSLGLVFPSTNG